MLFRIILALALGLVATSASLGLPSGQASGADGTRPQPPATYLALGDSLAAGSQPIGDPRDLLRTRSGYPDQLWLMARQRYADLRLVNLGCPGANTRTMMLVDERCPYPHGSQLDEALAVIEEDRDRLAFITIDIGFNDFPCTDDPACLEPGLESIRENLPIILRALRTAAPGTPIVGMTIYDPYLPAWLDGGELMARLSVAVVGVLNTTLEGIYRAAGVAVADVEGAFATDDFGTLLPLAGHGRVPRNVALVCLWTWLCFPPPLGPDRHPNVLGHRVIAEAFARELGLLPPLASTRAPACPPLPACLPLDDPVEVAVLEVHHLEVGRLVAVARALPAQG